MTLIESIETTRVSSQYRVPNISERIVESNIALDKENRLMGGGSGVDLGFDIFIHACLYEFVLLIVRCKHRVILLS